jgi:two-component system sensor histidine kinase AtoS
MNKKKLETVMDKIAGLEAFLSDMTDLTKFSEPNKEMASVGMVTDEVASLLEEELTVRHILLDRVEDPYIPMALFDPKQIRQVLTNVFKNAMEAMAHGGRLLVETRLRPDRIAIRVSDTGKGIAQEDLDRIFHPFFSTKPKGRGLGLAISRKIMLDHGGDLEIESTKNEGAICILTLPL